MPQRGIFKRVRTRGKRGGASRQSHTQKWLARQPNGSADATAEPTASYQQAVEEHGRAEVRLAKALAERDSFDAWINRMLDAQLRRSGVEALAFRQALAF